MRSTAPCRIASAIDTAREASRLLTSLPSASATSPGAASGERRVRHLLGQTQQLVADRVGRRRDAVRHRGRDPRSAFDRRLRQARVAELDADVVERQPQHVGRDLRHDGVGAGADVGGRARHLGMAVGGEHDAHRDRHLQGFPDARRHAPADQIAAVAHRARLGIALGPAERLRALTVALAQRLAAVRLVLVLVAVRIAAQAKLERVELERDREFVHGGFSAKSAVAALGARISHEVGRSSRASLCAYFALGDL